MSDFEPSTLGRAGRARATLEQLHARWGHQEDLAVSTDKVQLIFVRNMAGQRETWKRLSGTGKGALFERIE